MYLYCYFLHRNNGRLNHRTNPYNISVTQQRLSLVSLGYLWRTASETNAKQQFCTCVLFFQLHFFAITARQRHHPEIFLSLSKLDAVRKSWSIVLTALAFSNSNTSMSRSDPKDGSLLRNVFCDDQLKKRLRRKNRIGRRRQAKKSRMAPRNGDDPDNCIIIQSLEFNSKKQILIGIVS